MEKPITDYTPEALMSLVMETEDKDILRAVADHVGIKYSGNTGIATLKENILAEIALDEEKDSELDEDDPVVQAMRKMQSGLKNPVIEEKPKSILEHSRAILAEMDPRQPNLSEPEKRAIVRAKAMRLHRVRITNMDPNDSAVPGAIKTVYNRYTGKVSKFIPFGEENELGYHVPEILLNAMAAETYNHRREVKQKGANFGVKRYKTVSMKKFAIEYLTALTDQELIGLAQDQKARGAIDQSGE